jgi:hypothetical protein
MSSSEYITQLHKELAEARAEVEKFKGYWMDSANSVIELIQCNKEFAAVLKEIRAEVSGYKSLVFLVDRIDDVLEGRDG